MAMTKAEINRYCKEALIEIQDDLPKQYVKDVFILAQESNLEFDLTPSMIRNVKNGLTPNKSIVDLLKKVALINKMALSSNTNCN